MDGERAIKDDALVLALVIILINGGFITNTTLENRDGSWKA